VNKKILKKDPKLKLNLKYFWENWFKNGTDSNKLIYEAEPVYETGLLA